MFTMVPVSMLIAQILVSIAGVSGLPAASPSATPSLSPSSSPTPLNSTSSQNKTTVGWQSTPQTRGTFDLLVSSLATLFLCAWTAYHPNVHCMRGLWRQMAHRLLWMLIAVFFPEIVLFCAWEQWWACRRLRDDIANLGSGVFGGDSHSDSVVGTDLRERASCGLCSSREDKERVEDDGNSTYGLDIMFADSPSVDGDVEAGVDSNERCRDMDEPNGDKKKRRKEKKPQIWTMEQSFFALSGGFAVSSDSFFPHARLTFTPAGLVFLAKLGLLPDEPPEVVADKSKADYAAKILVCVQAGWFFVQCIARLAQKLPLTLMELHVLTHVLCAFAMYLVWIDKPYDVGNPVICKDEKVVDIAAVFALHVEQASERFQAAASWQCAQKETSRFKIAQVQTAHASSHSPSVRRRYREWLRNYTGEFSRVEPLPDILHPDPTPQAAAHLERANAGLEYLRKRGVHFDFESRGKYYVKSGDPKDPVYHEEPESSVCLNHLYIVPLRSNLMIDGMNAFEEDEKRWERILSSLKTYAGLSAGYGGLHLAAWNFRFPSSVEMWMWRGSGVVMVGAPVLTGIAVLGIVLDSALSSKSTKSRDGHRPRGCLVSLYEVSIGTIYRIVRGLAETIQIVGIMLAAILWVLYFVARSYVFVEAFVALRASDRNVYRTVEWTNFIPHAG